LRRRQARKLAACGYGSSRHAAEIFRSGVAVHGVHEADGLPYLVMQFVPGGSLQARLDSTEAFEESDLRQVRIVGITADAAATLDVRVTELRIHADLLPKGTPAVATRAGRTWPLLLVFPLVLLLPLGVWLYVRRRRAPPKLALAAVTDVQAEPEAASPYLTFACPGCRKKLKVRAQMAGKKLKCPACGQKVHAPTARRSDPEGAPPESGETQAG